jgi:formylglycine-generating enzyme required for sulfatase activity/tRNA A-37 threonylcarbamoyl transferase component Bud32
VIDSTINGYTIQRLIGSGGMADVYYAENRLGRPCAIKVLKLKYSDDEAVRTRFEQEALAMQALDAHPNIRSVIDLGEADGRPAMLMEYLEGETLKECVKNRRAFTDEALQQYFRTIANALQFTHSHNIIHRDIKPSNIFVTQNGEIKILDFGIAKVKESRGTLTGQMLGTLMYMSPEQIDDVKRVGAATDIYSLGVTFYHLLTGRPPYDETTTSQRQMLNKIVEQPLPLQHLPVHWQNALGYCLAKKAEDRDLNKALAALSSSEAAKDTTIDDLPPAPDPDDITLDDLPADEKKEKIVPPLPPPPTPVVVPKTEKNNIPLIAAVAALVIGVLAFVLWPDTGSPIPPAPVVTDSPAPIQKLLNDMVRIQGGTFKMGCTSEQGSDCYDDEKPTHSVTLSNFYIGKYEVTQAQWRAVMGSNPSHFSSCGDNCPVENVNWDMVQDFIRKLNQMTGKNFRLPTEAEWEFAARGGASASSATKYAGSNSIGSVAWYTDNSGSKTHPVGQKSPNELGLYDMTGNVWEWCSDWYGDYSSSSKTNPRGPSTGSDRVFRGGSWRSNPRGSRVSGRNGNSPGGRNSILGVRLALQSQ